MNSTSFITCPHCKCMIEIPHNQINCSIYRHAIIKLTGQQLDPHAPKEICDKLAKGGLIYGCGKPFRVVKTREGTISLEKCDYI